ncbi:RNA helicase [Plasmodiophora brassicae]
MPGAPEPSGSASGAATQPAKAFTRMGLDARLWKATAKMGLIRPTLIQSHTIPIALTGKDMMVRAKTGSGKTLAFLVPAVQHLLTLKSQNICSRVLVLVPTKDLCKQTAQVASSLLHFSYDAISLISVDERNASAPLPDDGLSHIVIGTPSSVLTTLRQSSESTVPFRMLIVDEADLVLSYGHDDDLRELHSIIGAAQTILVSATLNPELDALKSLVLRHPVTVTLNDEDESDDALRQLVIPCSFDDRHLIVFALMKVGGPFLQGKTLFFVSDVAAAYKLRLFLEGFGVRSAVLNEELPVNSRADTINSFNRGLIDHLIATDGACDPASFSAARGIDFVDVANVVNFDLPTTLAAYVHRVGRCARNGASGTSITLLPHVDAQSDLWQRVIDHYTDEDGVCDLKPLELEMDAVRAFSYRVSDVLASITTKAVKEARLSQLKEEIVNSERLQSHFEDNPRELALLHDRVLRPASVKPHLSRIPSYLLPHDPNGAAPMPEEQNDRRGPAKRLAESRMNKRDRYRLKHQRQKANPLKLNKGKGGLGKARFKKGRKGK